ncbi:MAG: hypothetical protein SFY81_01280 [Verrucomicrobiota bacterium]|nr:hypothetical protein [Verrucomicrobiota bacterium]
MDAFEGATADVRFKVGPVIFEQDTILRNLPPPEQFNMDRNSTLVRVTTEFIFDPKLPDTKSKFHETTPQTEDEVMSIGDLDFVQGKAFSEAFSTEYGFKADNAHSRVVRKQWLKSSGNDLLEESIPFVEIEKLSPNVTGNTIDNTGSSTRESSQNGFVIDYVVVSGSSFIFRQGVTYYVQTSGYFGGQVTFEGGSIIKMNNSSSLLMYGPVSCQGGATTVITSKYDDSVGETIPGVTGTPQRFSGPALWSYYISGAYTFDNFHIKNGTVGAQFDYNASPYLYPVLKNITFESCGTAIIANRCTVDANNVIFCTVDRLTQTFNSGSVGLANTSTDCDGVIAFRSLPANTILSGYKELPLKVVTGHEKALGISLFIEDYGMADGAEVHQTNGQWVVKWETYLDYNGTRSIFLQMDRGFEEGSGKVSSSVPIQIKNLITVDPLDVPFVSQVNMIGYTTEPYDSYKLEVFSPNRTLLFTIYGSLVDIEEGYKQFSYIWICKARQTAAIMFPIPPSSLM